MSITLNDKVTLFLFAITVSVVGFMVYASKTGQFETHKSWVYSIDINKQDVVVSASENELLFWQGRRCIDKIVGHSNAIKTVDFSPDGQRFASGGIDKLIKIWSSANKKTIQVLNGHSEGVERIKFSNSNKYIVSAGYDGKMLIWDLKSSRIIKKFNIKHTEFSISNQDILAFIDKDYCLTFFDLKTLSVIKVFRGFCGRPLVSPQGDLVAIKDIIGNSFTFLDVKQNRIISTLNVKSGDGISKVSTFTFTPDGRYVVMSVWGGDIEIWDWKQKKLVRILRGHVLNSVNDLAFTSNNQLISASGDKSLKFWDWTTGDLKMAVGDGVYQSKLKNVLSVSVLLTLMAGFWALMNNGKSILSGYIMLSILTLWTLGSGLLFYNFRSALAKYTLPIIWASTALSGLFFLSIWFSWYSFYIISIALFLCYMYIVTTDNKGKIVLPLLINLLFCVIIISHGILLENWR